MDRERQECPECNGSGVYQEYDEFDRYAVHACAKCDGSGELALIDAALAEPSDTDVAEAIEFWEKIKRQSIRCIKQSQNGKSYQVNLLPTLDNAYALDLAITALRQYQKPTDEAVQRAISWIESDKIDRQRDWDQQDHDWKSEPGAKEMHEDFMSAFELAIQGLRQMRTGPDCSTAEWQGGYCLGYGKSDTDDEPCETCKRCPLQESYEGSDD